MCYLFILLSFCLLQLLCLSIYCYTGEFLRHQTVRGNEL